MSFDLEKQLLNNYSIHLNKNGVSAERLASRFGALSKIGLTSDNGSCRSGFSVQERQAKDQVIEWMEAAGLSVREDGAGNIFGRLEGKNAGAPVLMSGSHVDSVPNGGHFDGTLGVLAALEVAQAWNDTNYLPEKPYEVVIFSDEEGSRFNSTLTGSEAMVGDNDRQTLENLHDQEGLPFDQAIGEAGLDVEGFFNAQRDMSEIESYVEVHIEQGKRLEKADLPTGIVTAIAGPLWMKLSFVGLAGHAGNTPMNDRQDALVAASEFIQALSQIPQTINQSAVATVGKIQVQPNGINVIPGQVDLYVDIRDVDKASRQAVLEKVLDKANQIASNWGVELINHGSQFDVDPMPVADDLQDKLAKASEKIGVKPFFLASGGGHDAMNVGRYVPSAMIFTRSKDGISHNPVEWSELDDCVQSVHLLKTYLEELQN